MDPFIAESKYFAHLRQDTCAANRAVAVKCRLIENAGAVVVPFPNPKPYIDPIQRKVYADVARLFVQNTPHTPFTLREELNYELAKLDAFTSQLGKIGYKSPVKDPKKVQRGFDHWAVERFPGEDMDVFFVPPPSEIKKVSAVTGFAKCEKIAAASLATVPGTSLPLLIQPAPEIKKGKKTRLILCPPPEMNILYGQIINPLDAYLCKHLSAMGPMRKYCPRGKDTGVPNPWIVSGYNKEKEAELMIYKYEFFKRQYGVYPYLIGLDAKGWDAHVRDRETEIWFQKKCFPNHDISPIVDVTKNVKIHTPEYTVTIDSIRISGSKDTAFSNKTSMTIKVITCFHVLGIKRFDIADKGDDCIIFVHPDDVDTVKEGFPRIFLDMGHELKLETMSSDIFQIEFCQSRLVRAQNEAGEEKWVWVADPRKIFATAGSHIHCRTRDDARRYFDDLLFAYSVIYPFVPLFRQLSNRRDRAHGRERSVLQGVAEQMLKAPKGLRESVHTVPDYMAAFNLPMSALYADVDSNALEEALLSFYTSSK